MKLMEGEMNDTEWPRYVDAIHLVRVDYFNVKKNKWHCTLTAFDPASDLGDRHWLASELHEPRGAEPNATWGVGDKVHVRCRRGRHVDGNAREVWVKAAIQKVLKGNLYIIDYGDVYLGKMRKGPVACDRIRSPY